MRFWDFARQKEPRNKPVREVRSSWAAKNGSRGNAPCRVKGQRPLWGLGQRPNRFAGDQFKGSRQQRRRQRSVPASNFARPQTRPQAAFPTSMLCRARWARPNCWSCDHSCFFPNAGVSPLRRRPKGFPIALWKPSARSLPCFLIFSAAEKSLLLLDFSCSNHFV